MVQWHYLAPSILFPLCRKGDTENTYLRRLFEVWVMNMTLHRVRLTSFDHSIKILGWPKLIWVFSVMLYAKSLQLWPTQPPDGLVTLQAPLSMGFSRQEYWRGLSCPPSGELPDPKIKLKSLMPPALAGGFLTVSTTWKAHYLPKFAQIHIHWVSDAVKPSHPLLSPSPALSLFQHQGLSHWVDSSHQVAKVLDLQRLSFQ